VTIPARSAINGSGVRRSDLRIGNLATVPHRRWDHLAQQATAQRAYLGYSIAQLAAISGLSTSTLDSIEHNRKTSYDPATLAALERALRWASGSVDRILKGFEPHPMQDPDLDAIIAAWPRLSPGARRMLRILATEGARAE
jgi:transcriptional regulator with XRE-family HTH domain